MQESAPATATMCASYDKKKKLLKELHKLNLCLKEKPFHTPAINNRMNVQKKLAELERPDSLPVQQPSQQDVLKKKLKNLTRCLIRLPYHPRRNAIKEKCDEIQKQLDELSEPPRQLKKCFQAYDFQAYDGTRHSSMEAWIATLGERCGPNQWGNF